MVPAATLAARGRRTDHAANGPGQAKQRPRPATAAVLAFREECPPSGRFGCLVRSCCGLVAVQLGPMSELKRGLI